MKIKGIKRTAGKNGRHYVLKGVMALVVTIILSMYTAIATQAAGPLRWEVDESEIIVPEGQNEVVLTFTLVGGDDVGSGTIDGVTFGLMDRRYPSLGGWEVVACSGFHLPATGTTFYQYRYGWFAMGNLLPGHATIEPGHEVTVTLRLANNFGARSFCMTSVVEINGGQRLEPHTTDDMLTITREGYDGDSITGGTVGPGTGTGGGGTGGDTGGGGTGGGTGSGDTGSGGTGGGTGSGTGSGQTGGDGGTTQTSGSGSGAQPQLPSSRTNPLTGDDLNIVGVVIALILSAAVVVIVVLQVRKRKKASGENQIENANENEE